MMIGNTEMSESEIKAYIHQFRSEIELLQRENYVMQEYITARYYTDIDPCEEEVHDYD